MTINSQLKTLRNELSIQWTVNGDDPLQMTREVRRLIAATRNFFKTNTLMPIVGGTIWCEDADYGPTVTPRSTESARRWIKSASIQTFWQAAAR